MPFLPASIGNGTAESRCVKEVKSRTSTIYSYNSPYWDSLVDKIEPLPMSTINQLGLDSQDDFQNFLRGLIK